MAAAVSEASEAAVSAAAEQGEAGRICDLRFAIVDLRTLADQFLPGSFPRSKNN